jgi:hypothetical protein
MAPGRRSRLALLGIAIIVAAPALGLAGVIAFATVTADRVVAPLTLPAIDHLRTGDLIFRSGISRDSHLIKVFDPGAEYSHVGLIDVRDGNAYVIHIEPGETEDESQIQREPLDTFLAPRKADGFAVFHVTGRREGRSLPLAPADETRGRAAVLAALNYMSRHVVFDHDFSLDTNDAMYCSELVWRAYLETGLDLLDGDFGAVPALQGGHLIRLSGLVHSRHLTPAETAGSTE